MNKSRQARFHCPGCHRPFSPRGLTQHITKSQRPSCRALQATPAFQSLRHNLISSARLLTPWTPDPANAADTTHAANTPDASATTNTYTVNTLEDPQPTGHEGAVAAGGYQDSAGVADDEDAAGATNHEDVAMAAGSEDTAEALLDADIFETLVQDFNCSSDPGPFHPTPPDQPHADRSQSSDSAPPSPEHLEHDNYDQPTVFIDHFPHGNPGARMHEAPQGHHIYQSSEDMFGSSHWAPFRSQRDWQIAHWAKTRGPMSSALADLLAIPNVRTRHLFAISRY